MNSLLQYRMLPGFCLHKNLFDHSSIATGKFNFAAVLDYEISAEKVTRELLKYTRKWKNIVLTVPWVLGIVLPWSIWTQFHFQFWSLSPCKYLLIMQLVKDLGSKLYCPENSIISQVWNRETWVSRRKNYFGTTKIDLDHLIISYSWIYKGILKHRF